MTPLLAPVLPSVAPAPGALQQVDHPIDAGDDTGTFLDMFATLQSGPSVAPQPAPESAPENWLTGSAADAEVDDPLPLLPGMMPPGHDLHRTTLPVTGQETVQRVAHAIPTMQDRGLDPAHQQSRHISPQGEPGPAGVKTGISPVPPPVVADAGGPPPLTSPVPPTMSTPPGASPSRSAVRPNGPGDALPVVSRVTVLASRDNLMARPIRTDANPVAGDAVPAPDLLTLPMVEEATLPAIPAETRRMASEAAANFGRSGTDGPAPAERQIVSAILTSGTGRTDILLDPQDLGRVRLSLEGNEAGLVVIIAAERAETSDLLRRNADLLLAEFREAGYENLSFSFADHGPGPDPWAEPEDITEGTGPLPEALPSADTDRGLRGTGVLDLRL
jgi:flagellar hook-length control protein FliK